LCDLISRYQSEVDDLLVDPSCLAEGFHIEKGKQGLPSDNKIEGTSSDKQYFTMYFYGAGSFFFLEKVSFH
jgi:hypothetical protein